MFRPSDVRRVQAAFDAGLPAPYEATVTVEDSRITMRVSIMDPDDDTLPVAQAVWTYDAAFKYRKQPTDAELADIVTSMTQACNEYTGE